MKAVIYTRVSTEEQAKDNHHSLDAQKRQCKEFAKKWGYTVLSYFEDAGKSASKIKGRDALMNMLEYIKIYKPEILIVQHTDRLTRNTLDHLNIKIELKKYGTKLMSVTQPNLDDTPEGKLMDTLTASVSQYHSDITSRKTLIGMEEKARKGWLPMEAPIGYRNIVNSKGQRIIIQDRKKAKLIREAFELYATSKYGVEILAEIMQKKGLEAKRGGIIRVSKMLYILRNPFYYGDFKWNQKIYKGKHQPIVSKELWYMVQQIINSRAQRRQYERKYFFLLSGFIICECGRKFTAEHHHKKCKSEPYDRIYTYYHCTRGRRCESSPYISLKILEDQVLEEFKKIQFSPDFFRKLSKELESYHNNHKSELDKKFQELKREKQGLISKRHKAEDLLLEGSISKEVYKRMSDDCDKKIHEVEIEIAKLKNSKNIDIGKVEDLINFSKNIYKTYEKAKPETKRILLGLFWESFIVSGKHIIKSNPTPILEFIQNINADPNYQLSLEETKVSDLINALKFPEAT